MLEKMKEMRKAIQTIFPIGYVAVEFDIRPGEENGIYRCYVQSDGLPNRSGSGRAIEEAAQEMMRSIFVAEYQKKSVLEEKKEE